MKHYKRFWRESPGAMTVLHIIVMGLGVSLAFVERNPLISLAALAVTCLVAAGILPVCVIADLRE